MNRHIFLFIACLSLYGLGASAQIALQVSTERDRYLTYETVLMKVVLRNNSGNQLDFGSYPEYRGYVRLEVLDRTGRRVAPKLEGFNAADGLVLPPGASKSVVIPVNDYFDMVKEGYYQITARIGHSRFTHDLLSQTLRVKVSDGFVKWERDIGVPGSDPTKPVERRTASIVVLQADRSQIYCLRVQDEKYVYAVTRLAPRVGGVEPQCEVDARSHIHFFVQTEPRLFSHWEFDYNGKLKHVEHFMVEEFLPIPRLIRDPDIGRVMVIGGKLAREGVDFNDVILPVMEAQEVPDDARRAQEEVPKPPVKPGL